MKCPHCGHDSREDAGEIKSGNSGDVAPTRTLRIARPRPSGGAGRPGTGYVSPMDCDFPEEDDAA